MAPLPSLLRVIRQGDGDLLSLIPKAAYSESMTPLGYSRRSIVLVNSPELCREVLYDKDEIFPKNDLFVGALEPLIGDSIFVSSGETWRRQRRMVDTAFSHIRVTQAFDQMQAAVSATANRWQEHAADGSEFSLDVAMSHLTADVICRTTFTEELGNQSVQEVYDAFTTFEKSVASVNLGQLIFGKPWAPVKQPQNVLDACQTIRTIIGGFIDPRLENPNAQPDDMAAAILRAKDTDTGESFTREELIDQLGVFFLAGHETSASVLIWVFYIVSVRTDVADTIRQEIQRVCGDDAITFEHTKQMTYTRNVFKETLRLYPPITFIPRVANKDTRLGGKKIKKGAMVMVSPWTSQRNSGQWDNANVFDPDRFAQPSKDGNGVFMSFGLGPRVCVGAAYATTEAILIIATLIRQFDIHCHNADNVRPVARLTTRPAEQLRCSVKPRTA
jgi:cytochrome P450